MQSARKKILSAVMSVLLLSAVHNALAQLPPPAGTGTPPAGNPPTGTPPATGPGTPPAPGGTATTPPAGGTPPTGNPPAVGAAKPCFVPAPGITAPPGVEVCKFSIPTAGGSATGEPNSFFKSVTTEQLAGLGAEQMKKFDPTAASGFTPAQLGALSPDAMKGMGTDMIKNLAPTAVAGMKDAQIASLQPDAIKGFTPEQIKNLPPDAVNGFKPTQISQMQPDQLAAFKPEQFVKLEPTAIAAVTPEQFKKLTPELLGQFDTSKLAALDPTVIKALDKESLAKLDTQAVKKLDSKEMSEMLVNLNKQTLAPADVKNLLPPGWSVDDKTGKLQPPAGAALTLPTASAPAIAPGVTVDKLPNLNTGLAIGGDTFGGTIIDGMQKALEDAGLKGFNMSQQHGILKVEGSGASKGANFAFIPDGNGVKQAPAGTPPGLTQNAEGKYVLTTPDGVQVPIIPALTSPEGVQKVSPGAKVEVDGEGSTRITENGKNPVVGIPNPVVAPSSKAPGIYRQGSGANEQVVVVYDNGTEQALKPAIADPDEFREATKAFPQIKNVTLGTDGVIKIDYNGQVLQLRPGFDVKGTSTEGSTSAAPSIVPISATTFRFTNSKGESQDIHLGE